MATEQLKYFKFSQPSTKSFPAPESNNISINTLWQEEVFRNRSKAVRIQINEIEGDLHVGLGNWFYSMQSQEWAPCKGQLNLPREAWKKLDTIRHSVNEHLDNFDTAVQKTIEKGSMNFFTILIFENQFRLRINFHS